MKFSFLVIHFALVLENNKYIQIYELVDLLCFKIKLFSMVADSVHLRLHPDACDESAKGGNSKTVKARERTDGYI